MLGPGGVGDRAAPQVVGQRLDQRRRAAPAPRPAAGDASRACGSRVPSTAQVGDPEPPGDEVDGLADGLDPGRLLLRDADPVGVLELHHELVEVERVGVEVVAEPGRLDDLVDRDLELGRQVLADLLQDALAAQPVDVHRPLPITTRRSPAERSPRIAPRVMPDRSSSSAVRSTARSSTARAARRTALAMPSRPRAAVTDDRHRPQAEQDRPAGRVGVHLAAQPAERGAQQQAARGGARPGARRGAHRVGHRRSPSPRSSSGPRCR